MTQVIIFFGWLLVSIAATLVVFGHVSIGFVYGIDRLLEDLFPSEGLSSLIYSSIAFIPGAIMVGIGKMMLRGNRRHKAPEDGEANSSNTDQDT